MADQWLIVSGSDSIQASAGSWSNQYFGLGATFSKGDSGAASTQSAACYSVRGGNAIWHNMGVSGTRLETGSDNQSSVIANYILPMFQAMSGRSIRSSAGGVARSAIPRRRGLFLFCVGTNDGCVLADPGNGNIPSVSYFAQRAAYWANTLRAAGVERIGMATVLPRRDASASLTQANMDAYNTMIKGGSWQAANNVDFVIDLQGEATMGLWATPLNATYYIDAIHPTAVVGHGLLATQAALALDPVMAQLGI